MRWLVPLLLLLASLSYGLDSVAVDGVTYEQIKLKKEYPSSLFIEHAGGMVFIEKSKLTEDQIASLVSGASPTNSEDKAQASENPADIDTKQLEQTEELPTLSTNSIADLSTNNPSSIESIPANPSEKLKDTTAEDSENDQADEKQDTAQSSQETVDSISKIITPEGGRMEPTLPNTRLGGIALSFPKNAVEKDTKITVSTLSRKERSPKPSGELSDVWAKVETDGLKEFLAPVTLEISYDPKKHKKQAPALYFVVDKESQLTRDHRRYRPDLGSMHIDLKGPAAFTWVYVPMSKACPD